MEHIKIAVIGLGPAGLTALKNLREEGFDAIALERRNQIGGLWSFSSDTTVTSALSGTVCNVSKFVSSFSDYPIPKDYPAYPTSTQIAYYFNSYASKFNLRRHIRFNTTVNRVTRNDSDSAWNVHVTSLDGEAILSFDKVVFGHGCESVPRWPPMANRDKFKGVVIHSQAYKNPEPFRDKRVLVVGIGNTACEVSLALRRHTSKLYQSYRRGRIMLSRYLDNGVPMDTQYSWPTLRLKYFLDDKIPWLMTTITDAIMTKKMISDAARSEPGVPEASRNERLKRAGRRLRNDWRLLPSPSLAHTHPAVQEDFIPALREGDVIPVRGFEDFVGQHQVLLEDGTTVEVDAVIFCTGYDIDFSVMPEMEMDGAGGLPMRIAGDVSRANTADQAETIGKSPRRETKPHLPRLFQMIFPPRRASSAAFLSWMAPQENVWCVCELASMAVAQIWAAEIAKTAGSEQLHADGHHSPAVLPSVSEMNAQVDTYHNWWRGEWEKENSTRPGYVQAYPFYRYLHDAAGTGLYDNLDHTFTSRGWRLWWNDRELWSWLARGPMNSHSWRLFDTNPKGIPGCGRKAWPGARAAMQESFEAYKDFERQTLANREDATSPNEVNH
ncbi:FAD/NAD(P)-binding domain-containing protein [Hypoxylon sp. NC1633]|nr:FAD/NAD(P)-binding domain-containing protein [Hypoxylon sp. NC1633]